MDEVVYLSDILKKNGDKLVRYNKGKQGKEYMFMFTYSTRYGGAVDSHKYYNDWVVELGSK